MQAGSSRFVYISDSDPTVPAELGQESQASSCLRKGTPLASRGAQGVSGPSSCCVWNPRVFPDDARGSQCPFVLCFPHRVAFEEVSGHRVLLKSGPGNRGLSACGTTHVGSLEFPHETGLILRCAAKVMKPFQTSRGIDPPVAIRRGEVAQMKFCWEPRCFPQVRQVCRVTFGVA